MRLENEDENIRDLNQTGVRIPSALKAKIKEAAKQNKHSMNAEIVTRLEKSFSNSAVVDDLFADNEMVLVIKNAMKGLLDDGVISLKDGMISLK